MLVYTFYDKMVECHTELVPFVVGHHEKRVGGGFQGAYLAVDKAEILEDTTQLRTQPQRAGFAVDQFEDKEAAGFLRMTR